MISKSQIKLITSLGRKKYRDKTGLFVAEGPKLVSELLTAGFSPYQIFTTEAVGADRGRYQEISEVELRKISFLKSPQSVVGVFYKPEEPELDITGLTLVLDNVQDPGNVGTLIRLCDWFGVQQLICSPHTADCYNPKVVQATMGSIARVRVHYQDLEPLLQTANVPVYGAFMEGANVYKMQLPAKAMLVLGNEGKGISRAVEQLVTERVSIPQFGSGHHAESLNVATAGAILLSEFKRSTER